MQKSADKIFRIFRNSATYVLLLSDCKYIDQRHALVLNGKPMRSINVHTS